MCFRELIDHSCSVKVFDIRKIMIIISIYVIRIRYQKVCVTTSSSYERWKYFQQKERYFWSCRFQICHVIKNSSSKSIYLLDFIVIHISRVVLRICVISDFTMQKKRKYTPGNESDESFVKTDIRYSTLRSEKKKTAVRFSNQNTRSD